VMAAPMHRVGDHDVAWAAPGGDGDGRWVLR